jgi:hypothetical protein
VTENLTMQKLAYYSGQARALQKVGLTENQIKLAFVEQGFTVDEAEGIYKEAIWGAIGRGLMAGAKFLGKNFGSAAKATAAGAKAPASVMQTGGMLKNVAKGGQGMLTNIRSGAGTMKAPMVERMAGGLHSAGQAIQKAPGATLWGGAKNFGKGMMFSPHARGIGGVLGKGFGGYQVGSMLLGSGSSPQPRRMQGPSGYGQY